jgi:acetyltransferase-like isoleucine patch superfamily enzyme
VTPAITFSHPTVSGSVPSGTTFSSGTWLLSGATVGGGVSIGPNASVLIMNSTVSGNITASGGGAFGLCGTTTYGSVTVANASGFVVVGDPLDDGCAANTLNSGLTLSSNHGGVEVSHNARIGGTVTLQANSGPGANPDDVHPEIEANTIYGGLICSGDSPNAVDDAQRNTVSGARAGECGAPGF